MTASLTARTPNIWLNVTTSAAWTRNPVGIVRTEQEIAKHLRSSLGHRFREIVLEDGGFVVNSRRRQNKVSSAAGWPDPSYGESTDLFDPMQRPRSSSLEGVRPADKPDFEYGDILISLGLDWDHPKLHEELGELRRQYGLTVITFCYDLIPVLYPQFCVSDVAAWFKNYLIGMTWVSDGILCISEATRRDYLEFANDSGLPELPVEVITLGSSIPRRRQGAVPSAKVEKLVGERFFLFVSTIERRKNHEVLYRAYHLLRQEDRTVQLPKLVFVGMQGWGVEEMLSDIRLDPLLKDDIVILSHVSDEDLALLYEECDAVVFPSHYEGWGLPVAEALQFGKPVIASSAGSLPEVGKSLVRYVDPWSPRDWATELRRAAFDREDMARWAVRIREEFAPYEWSAAGEKLIEFATRVRLDRADHHHVIEPGYEMSTVSGISYGDRIIYQSSTGIACHGPYIGLGSGSYLAKAHCTVIDAGGAGYLRFIVGHRKGHVRPGVKRVAFETLSNGPNLIEIPFTLDSDVTDLELTCEVHSEQQVRLSVDRVEIEPAPEVVLAHSRSERLSPAASS